MLLPQQALAERPLVPLGGWDEDADTVIEALRRAPLRNSTAQRTRGALIAAMDDELEIARGGRAPEAMARQSESALAMIEAWAALVVAEGAEGSLRVSD